MQHSKLPIITAVIIGFLILAIMSTFQLRLNESAIVTTLGKPKEITKPGLYFRFPWPVQKVVRFDTRLQLLTSKPRETTTQDKYNIIVNSFALWSVTDTLTFYKNIGSRTDAELQLRELIEGQQTRIIQNKVLADFFAEHADSTAGVAAVEAELLASVSSAARKQYGVEVKYIGFSQVLLPESNTEAVFARMIQEQQSIAAKIRSEGEREAKITRNTADERRASMIAEAQAEAREIQGKALIEASSHYPVFEEDIDFAIFLRNLDALKETMKTKTTLLLNPDSMPYNLLDQQDLNTSDQ